MPAVSHLAHCPGPGRVSEFEKRAPGVSIQGETVDVRFDEITLPTSNRTSSGPGRTIRILVSVRSERGSVERIQSSDELSSQIERPGSPVRFLNPVRRTVGRRPSGRARSSVEGHYSSGGHRYG